MYGLTFDFIKHKTMCMLLYPQLYRTIVNYLYSFLNLYMHYRIDQISIDQLKGQVHSLVPTDQEFFTTFPFPVFTHNLNYLSDSHVTSSRLSLVLRVHFSLLFFDPVSLLMAYQHEKKGKTSLDFRHIVVVILVLANQ